MAEARDLCREIVEGQSFTRTRSGWSAYKKYAVVNSPEAMAMLPQLGSRWSAPGQVAELVCVKHTFEPIGKTTASLRTTPTHYQVTAEFLSTTWTTDPVITFETDLEVMDTARLRQYVSDDVYRLENSGIVYPLIGLSIEVQKRAADLHETMELLGKINNANVQVLGRYNWGARKLLFAGFNSRIEYDETGTQQFHCYYKFQYRPNIPSWNHVHRTEPGEKQGKFDEIYPPLYQAADFSPLAPLLNGGQ